MLLYTCYYCLGWFMERYLVDFDGVVLDSQTIFDRDMNGNSDFGDWNYYLNNINWEKFYKNCGEIDDAFDSLIKLQYLGKLEAILSSIHSFDEGREKTIILRNKGVLVPIVFALPMQSKSFIYPPKRNITLVDDKESNCLEYEKSGGKALIFKPEYKGNSKKIVKSLKELL